MSDSPFSDDEPCAMCKEMKRCLVFFKQDANGCCLDHPQDFRLCASCCRRAAEILDRETP